MFNLRNFRGDILNTFRGTPEQILADMKATLDNVNYGIWAELFKDKLSLYES